MGERDTLARASASAAIAAAADREAAIAKFRSRHCDFKARSANTIPPHGLKATAPS
ncbi:hypothetical protein GLE_0938 [Lysobacter enzymogenes]|uniref:Uncharacterized protein n=1 Tax=Lysobacter enzymogenes TaxID=69 RepID=A0A0S2DD59_LYSEN|nr:hypothetical protein GLE_0938 [Lysobacter enzymogenes]